MPRPDDCRERSHPHRKLGCGRCRSRRQAADRPVFSIIPYDTIEEAVAGVNNSRYGLQAGVFTTSLYIAHYAAEHIEAGGVVINDGSSFRMDNMPYGGVKDSGMGKEGPEYAIRELTEEKTIIMNFD